MSNLIYSYIFSLISFFIGVYLSSNYAKGVDFRLGWQYFLIPATHLVSFKLSDLLVKSMELKTLKVIDMNVPYSVVIGMVLSILLLFVLIKIFLKVNMSSACIVLFSYLGTSLVLLGVFVLAQVVIFGKRIFP